MDFVSDVTEEYLKKYKNKTGKLFIPEDYDRMLHSDEIFITEKIMDLLGGKIRLLNELNKDKTMTPDMEWNNRYWEIKHPTTYQAADSAIRKGMKQIRSNPGGIILFYDNIILDEKRILSVISVRMKKIRNIKRTIDIAVIHSKDKIKVYRYK